MAKKTPVEIKVGMPNVYDNVPVSKKINVSEIKKQIDAKISTSYDNKTSVKIATSKENGANVTKVGEKSPARVNVLEGNKEEKIKNYASKEKLQALMQEFYDTFKTFPPYGPLNEDLFDLEVDAREGVEWLDEASEKLETGKAYTYTKQFQEVKREAKKLIDECDNVIQAINVRDLKNAHADEAELMTRVFFNDESRVNFEKVGMAKEYDDARAKLKEFFKQKEIFIEIFDKTCATTEDLKNSYLNFDKVASKYIRQHPEKDKGRDL